MPSIGWKLWSQTTLGLQLTWDRGNGMEQGRFGIVSGCFRYYMLYIYTLYIYIVSWCPCYRPIHIFVLLICSNHRLLIIHCSSFRPERAQQSSQIRPNKNTSSKKRSQSQLPGAANQLSSRTCATIIKKRTPKTWQQGTFSHKSHGITISIISRWFFGSPLSLFICQGCQAPGDPGRR